LWFYGRGAGGSSVTGGVFYTGDRYPQAYQGAYFFGDYSGLRMWTMQFDASGQITRAPESGGFGTSVGRPVKFNTGPNGDVVFADIGTGKLNRLSYVPGNRPPTAVATTTTDPATLTVTFDGGRSYDLDGDPLTYEWTFGDGTTGSGMSVTHTYAAGVDTATARLTVSDPAGATGSMDIAVAPANYQPQLTLTAPGPGQTFAVGDTVSASATATDAEDGPLTVQWATTLVHCRETVCHNHPGQTSTGPSYAELFANHEDDTRMQVTASATDSHGVTTSQAFEALPRLRTLTLNSTVPATMTIGSTQRNVASVIANATTSFSAATTATDGVATFDRWSDAGAQLRTAFTMPDADVTLTATYLTPIDRRFTTDAALRALIGPATSGEQGSATLRWRDHANGARLYWTPSAGVHEVHGAILGNFLGNGGHAVFGVPTTDERTAPDGIGKYNHFTGTAPTGTASIYWSPSTGAHEVHGAIRTVWAATGWEQGLGYPLTNETVTPDGVGRYNHFSNGGSIYWSPSTGAHEVYGAIRQRWAALGWELSYLGYPTSGEFSISGGRRSNFQYGYITWSSTTGQVTDRRY